MSGFTMAGLITGAVLILAALTGQGTRLIHATAALIALPVLLAVFAANLTVVALTGGRGCTCYPDD